MTDETESMTDETETMTDETETMTDETETMTDETETCLFCGTTATADEAIEAGWMPEFYMIDEGVLDGPACVDCAEAFIHDLDGEYDGEYDEATLQIGHVVPKPRTE